MKIFYSNLAGTKFTHHTISIPVLVSFYGISKNFKQPEHATEVMLDSGAFSAKQQKITIDLDKYIKYCQENKDKFSVLVALDVIGNPKASFDNYLVMKDAGIDCVPVYHMGEPIEYLYKYADLTDYIGLGGMAAQNKSLRSNFLERIFTSFPDPKKIGFHGFGMGDPEFMLRYPWKSTDATSVAYDSRCGVIRFPWFKRPINPSVKSYGAHSWRSEMKNEKIFAYIRGLGLDPDIAQQGTTEGTEERCMANILYFEKLREQVPTIYKPVIKYLGF